MNLSKKFLDFEKDCHNCILVIQRNTLGKKNFDKKFNFRRTLSKIFSEFEPKTFGDVVKRSFYLSGAKFWEKTAPEKYIFVRI